jgi:hypothetical protein
LFEDILNFIDISFSFELCGENKLTQKTKMPRNQMDLEG